MAAVLTHVDECVCLCALVSRDAKDRLEAMGATVVDTPAEVARSVSRVVTVLPNDRILKEVCHAEDTGLLAGLQDGADHYSCSTVSPHTSRELAPEHEAVGANFVGAPIFARPDGLAAAQASFVLGGKAAPIARAEALLAHTSTATFVFGEDAGAGNVVKLCGNFLIGAAIESIAESLALAEAHGLDRVEVMNMLNSTIFDCLIYKGYGQRVSERDHKPGGFALELGSKDVTLVFDTAHKAKVPMPIASLLHDRFLAAEANGRSWMDWSAIGLSVSEDAGVDVSKAIAEADAAPKDT